MSWSTTQVADKSIDLFVPSEADKPAGVVLFLHGYDGVTLKDNPAYSRELAKHNLIGLCPLGEHCWWTDAIYPPYDPIVSPLEYLSQQILPYCEQRWQIEPPRIAVCGVEMGGQGALQLAYRHARKFPTVVAISPKIDFETWWGHGTSLDTMFPDTEAARQRTAILHLHPLNYPKHQLLLCDPRRPLLFRRNNNSGQQTLVNRHCVRTRFYHHARRLRLELRQRHGPQSHRIHREVFLVRDVFHAR